jgi:hypothetical protein
MDSVPWGFFIVIISATLAVAVAWSDELKDRQKRR